MNGCIDMGNTSTKIAFFEGEKMQSHHMVENHLEEIIALVESHQPDRVLVSSVGNEELTHQVIEQISQLCDVQLLSTKMKTSFSNAYQSLDTLGLVRFAAVAGAYHLYPNQNVLIIDAGTCLTLDFVDKEGVYQGGSILPGLQMRLQALHQLTNRLPLIESEWPEDFIGKNTKQSIQTGVLQGMVHELDGFIEQYRAEYGKVILILCGGDAHFFESRSKNEIFAHPNLVLEGMNSILNINI